MANSNVNIAEKMFAYIHHGVDITDDIKSIYNNSLIFIGDEKQIYVPVMNTYVGIGMTAYNQTIDAINDLANEVSQLAQTIAGDSVTRMFVDWNPENNDLLLADELHSELKNNFVENFSLSYQITLVGVHDYDTVSGFSYLYAYETDGRNLYKATGYGGGKLDFVNDASKISAYSSSTLATSGITITPHWGTSKPVRNELNGQVITRFYGNYIEVDDKLTWSYMTSAYSYTMKYARNYTDYQIDQVYHNLLGESETVYRPLAFNEVFEDVSDYVNKLTAEERAEYVNGGAPAGKLVAHVSNSYWLVDSNETFYLHSYNDANPYDGIDNSASHFISISASELVNYVNTDSLNKNYATGDTAWVLYDAAQSSIANLEQLYTADTVYNSSYNMNIKDGIQTLKEVAYLLDLLSDGTLGSTTYLTYLEWKNEHSSETFGADNTVTIDNVTYTRINENTNPADSENYVFYTNTGNPENLGIQIAYSIAGNQKQIEDLHYHIELEEEGKTTLRSIQSTDEDFGSIILQSNIGTNWTNTDTNQADLDNPNNINNPLEHPGNAYVVGDVNIKLELNTAFTYALVNESGNVGHVLYGQQWYGAYVAADMSRISDDGTTYYVAEVSGNVATFTAVDPDDLITNPRLNSGLQYYWVPDGGSNDENNNIIWKSILKTDYLALSATDYLPGTSTAKEDATMYSAKNTGSSIASPSDYNGTILYYKAGNKNFVLNPEIGENKLATTAWVSAYLTQSQDSINDTIDNVLELAYNYTDRAIDQLDNEYIYSDFVYVWEDFYSTIETAYLSDNSGSYTATGISWSYYELITPGSNTYLTAYDQLYSDFIDRASTENLLLNYAGNDEISGHEGEYRLSYQANSTVIYNVKEENGIVTAEARELPTDTITVSTTIWGADENVPSNRVEYSEVTGLDGSEGLINALYKWKDATDSNELFVETTNKIYQAIDPSESSVNINDSYILINSTYTKYSSFIELHTEEAVMTYYSATNDKAWKQLYRQTNSYVEIDLDPRTLNSLNLENEGDSDRNSNYVYVGDYILTYNTSAGSVTVTSSDTDINNSLVDGKLLYISSRPSEKVEYLTSSSKHFSYADNGDGGNELSVNANIVKLEDANENNSGFADAYDVKSWIMNYLSFIDISATVSASNVNTNPNYHKLVSLSYVTTKVANNDELSAEEKVLYTYNGTSFVTVTTPTISYYWADDDTYYADNASAGNPTGYESHANMGTEYGNGYLRPQYNKGNTNTDYVSISNDYFVRTEFAKTNAQNLTETQFGM